MTPPGAEALDPLERPEPFREALVAWFAAEGRDYPWRRTEDPYAILVSEMMLQQTQIATVLGRGYYERWMAAFPDAATLAAAPEEAVLKAWEGLGYYSRARNLQKAARAVVTEHGGVFPETVEGLLKLPGIGRYTAGAVASFAFNAPAPLVDGNVVRVFARLFACDGEVDRPEVQKKLWRWAEALVSPDDARRYNSALMELGQRICTPRAPACLLCPARAWCRSAGPAAVSRPRKGAAKKVVQVEEHALFALNNGRLLLHQETGRRRRGLWKLPERPAAECADLPVILTENYTITRHRVTVHIHAAPEAEAAGPDESWHPLETLASLAMPGPYRRMVERLLA